MRGRDLHAFNRDSGDSRSGRQRNPWILVLVALTMLASGCGAAKEPSASRSITAPPERGPHEVAAAQRQLRTAGFAASGLRVAAAIAASSPSRHASAESLRLVGLADRAATETLATLLPPHNEMYLAAVWNAWSRAELAVYGELAGENVPLCQTPAEQDPTASRAGGTMTGDRPVVDSTPEQRQIWGDGADEVDTDHRALEAARALGDWLQLAWGEARSGVVVGYLSRAMEARKCVVYLASTCRMGLGELEVDRAVEGTARHVVDSIFWEVRLLDYLAVARFWGGDGALKTLPLGPEDLESGSLAVEAASEAWRLWQNQADHRGSDRGEAEKCPSNPSWKERVLLRSLEMLRSRDAQVPFRERVGDGA